MLVIGGGTAGAVVAARLAQRTDRTVLLLEAGPDYGPAASERWPADLKNGLALPASHDWGYSGRSAGNAPLQFDRARVIGGCSAHNGCAQTWGWRGDYDALRASGLNGWAGSDLLPHFATAVDKMRIRRYRDDEVQPFHAAFVAAAVACGIPKRKDLDDLDGTIGVDITPINMVGTTRWNSNFAYLDEMRGSEKLIVRGETSVHSLDVSRSRVRGAFIHGSDGSGYVKASLVIVCGGAYGTPELLLRSGIGPATALRGAGITVRHAIDSVGVNLQDHASIRVEFEASATLAASLRVFSASSPLPAEQSIAKIASSRCRGPYDLHVYPWTETDTSLETGFKVIIPVGLLTPQSRGTVSLRSADRDERARIEPNFLSDASGDDAASLSDGLQFVLGEIVPRLRKELGRPLRVPTGKSQKEFTSWIRTNHEHYWHPAGSCKMGAPNAGGVVDAEGRIHGLDGLILADASIFPTVPRATTALPVVVAAERIAAELP